MSDNCHHSFMMIAELKKLLRSRRIFLFFHLLFFTTDGLSQDYNYINYDVKDGLAGSTVYSSGRVWMAPFKSTVCYYYNGKIYNQENDSLLKKINLNLVIYAFAEDHADSSIIMVTAQKIFIVKPSTSAIRELDVYLSSSIVRIGPNPFGKGIICATNDNVFVIIDGKLEQWSSIKTPKGHYVSEIFPDRTVKFIKYPAGPSLVEHIISTHKSIKVSFINSTMAMRLNY